jgi:hypothetical protein
MSAAYKYAILQAFCIPVSKTQDADDQTYKLVPVMTESFSQPVQGWEQWVADIRDVVRVCQSAEALNRVQETHRQSLLALSRERQDLYHDLGRTLADRRKQVSDAAVPVEQELACPKASPRRRRLKKEVGHG